MEFSQTFEPVLQKILLIEQPGHAPQHYRPYTTTFDNEIENSLMRLSAQVREGHATLCTQAVRNANINMFRPASSSMGELDMMNGWHTNRFSVYMLMETKTQAGTVREIIMGYTSHADISLEGTLDPNIRIFFNSYYRYNTVSETGPGGTRSRNIMQKNDQVLNPLVLKDHFSDSGTISLRPSDTLSALGTRELKNTFGSPTIIDNRYVVNQTRSMSRSTNVRPSNYLTSVLTGYNSAKHSEDDYGMESEHYNMAGEYCTEDRPDGIGFFNMMDNRFAYFSVGSVLLGDMQSLWPDRNDGRWTVSKLARGSLTNLTGTVEGWDTSFMETNLAFMITHIVPAILSDNLYVETHFSFTNQVPGGKPELGFDASAGLIPMFPGDNDAYRAGSLKTLLINELLSSVFSRNIGSFYLDVHCNILNSCHIGIQIDGGPMIKFSAPNFCSSATNPLLAANHSQLDHLATDIGSAIDAAFMPTEQYHGQFQF